MGNLESELSHQTGWILATIYVVSSVQGTRDGLPGLTEVERDNTSLTSVTKRVPEGPPRHPKFWFTVNLTPILPVVPLRRTSQLNRE